MSALKLITLLGIFNLVTSARILAVFPIPFVSHQSVFRVIVEELALNGHELVVLTPSPHEEPFQNVTEIELHNSSTIWQQGWDEFTKNHDSFTISPLDYRLEVVPRTLTRLIDAQVSMPGVKALINDDKQYFDLILCEPAVPLTIAISARFKAPVILISSFFGGEENFLTMGAAVHPIMLPDHYLPKVGKLNFWERIQQVYLNIRLRYSELQVKEQQNSMIRKHFGANAPTISELRQNVHMMFVNVHHIWDNNRPVPPSVVYMGGLHLKEPKPVPKELLAFLDASVNGVVYVSLGSKILFSDLPAAAMKVFLGVFASLPYDVLLKWNGGEMPDKPANVRLEKWLPQNDLLYHPKVKVFITHGGMQSTDEAIAAEVPLIGVPVYTDQWYNCQKYVQHGIGVELDVDNLNGDVLRDAIVRLAEEKSYRINLARLSKIMKEQRAGGLQKAVYWTDYVAKYGALHLRSPLADASIAEYLMLDVLAVVVVMIVVLLSLVMFVAKLVFLLVIGYVRSGGNKKVKAC